jgi:hypothetical protein
MLLSVLAIAASLHAGLAPDQRLSDPRSLRSPGLDPVLWADHLSTLDTGKVGHILPGPDSTPDLRPGLSLVRTGDTLLVLHPELGAEWRDPQGQGVLAGDVGGLLTGSTEHIAFWVDAHMFTDQTSESQTSWDGQYQEFHQEGNNSHLTYTSYSRYEGILSANTQLGRISIGRSREQWGPCVAYPLVLGSTPTPMPMLDWTLEWGDFRVRELWASLDIDGAGSFTSSGHTRSLYGHRYEWLATRWLTLGASEALIVYDHEELAALLPVAPLFMEKGQEVESDNNGELAFDAEVRPLRGVRVYGEFLIDDIQEPTTLFDNFWRNKWAATGGIHWAGRWNGNDVGTVLEYSHVEPWVYTHNGANTVQAAHQGSLLGNESGPNSRSIELEGYGVRGAAHVAGSTELVWKGTDNGSLWTDSFPANNSTTKTFLAGGGKLYARMEAHLGWSYRWATFWLDLGKTLSWANLQHVRPDAPVAVRVDLGM